MVLVYIESHKGIFAKSAFETVTYGYKTAQALGTSCVALCIGQATNSADLGKYGAEKVIHIEGHDDFDNQSYSSIISHIADELGAKVIILNNSASGKALIGRLAAKYDAGSIPGASTVPVVEGNKLIVKKSVFSGKAIATYEITSDMKFISVMGNSIAPEEMGGTVQIEDRTVDIPRGRVVVKKTQKIEGSVPLPEADLVVSAGRGMKGPENWGIIEELAESLGASTACSRPVADSDWRPHYEHVGQTGVAIHPNLYIAIGISGAIQHLAGVNNSKKIVVINKDPEAPFFKAADYGVVGDLFEVVPRLTAAVKKLKK